MHELTVREEKIMQFGSLIRRARRSQSAVWEFRWREPGPTGTWRHRPIVVGPTDQIVDESAARRAVAALQIEINPKREINPASNYHRRSRAAFPAARA